MYITPSFTTGVPCCEYGGPNPEFNRAIQPPFRVFTFEVLICASAEYRVFPQFPPTSGHSALGALRKSGVCASAVAAINPAQIAKRYGLDKKRGSKRLSLRGQVYRKATHGIGSRSDYFGSEYRNNSSPERLFSARPHPLAFLLRTV